MAFTQPSYLTNNTTADNDQYSSVWYGDNPPSNRLQPGFTWQRTGYQPQRAGFSYAPGRSTGIATPAAASNDVYGISGYRPIWSAVEDTSYQQTETPQAQEPQHQALTPAAETPFWQTSQASTYRDRLNEYYRDLQDQLYQATSQLPYIEYWDEPAVGALFNQAEYLQGLRDEVRRYIQSQDYGQAYGPGMVRPDFAGLENRYDRFRQQIAALPREQQRERRDMQAFAEEYRPLLNEWGSTLGGLGIADYDQANEIAQALRQMEQEYMSRNWRMDQGDLAGLFNQAAGLEAQLADLNARRESEMNRVNEAERWFRDALAGIGGNIPGLNMYSGNTLTGAEQDIQRLLNEMAGFQSDLPTDFASIRSPLQGYQSQIARLRQQRQDELNRIMGEAHGFGEQISGADLWDEEQIAGALEDLYGLTGDITRFTGGQAPDYYQQLQDLIESGEGRLGELTEYRGGIEERAQDLLARIQEGDYSAIAELEAFNPESTALQEELEQYGATQAEDEMAAIQQLIQSRIADIQAAERARALRDQQERERISQAGGNTAANPVLSPFAGGLPPIYSQGSGLGSYYNANVARALGMI